MKAFMWHIPGQPAIPQRVGPANLLQVDYQIAWNEFQLRVDPTDSDLMGCLAFDVKPLRNLDLNLPEL